MLSARPDLKKYTALLFRQEVKRSADAIGPGEDVVLVFMEALGLEPPMTLVCSDVHLQMEGYPAEQGGGDRDPAAAAREPPSCKGIWMNPGRLHSDRYRRIGGGAMQGIPHPTTGSTHSSGAATGPARGERARQKPRCAPPACRCAW